MVQVLIRQGQRAPCQALAGALAARCPKFRFERPAVDPSAYIVDTVRTVLCGFFTTDCVPQLRRHGRQRGRRCGHDRRARRHARRRGLRRSGDPGGVAQSPRPRGAGRGRRPGDGPTELVTYHVCGKGRHDWLAPRVFRSGLIDNACAVFIHSQQMRGSCSPLSMSTARSTPNGPRQETCPGGPLRTVPITVAVEATA